jgi:hypothetical protein
MHPHQQTDVPRFHTTPGDEHQLLGIANTKLWEGERQAVLNVLQELVALRQELRATQRDLRASEERLEALEQNAMDRDLLS